MAISASTTIPGAIRAATAPAWTITGGDVLVGDRLIPGALNITDGLITSEAAAGARAIDATGLAVLPGIVDVHGDAFERQIMPRPGVTFDLDIALTDTERQLAANGITTAFHGLTWSWEPGLRGAEMARAVVLAVARLAPTFAVDTHIHLRHEAFNLDAEAEIIGWMAAGHIAALAFNDHMTSIVRDRAKPQKLARMVERSGLSTADFSDLIARTHARHAEVPASTERLAAAARRHGVTLLSHDDHSPEERATFRNLGCGIAEFPVTVATAEAAAAANDWIVFGAPNVIRGGSHIGCPSAAEMVAAGLCSVLASDYYYPSLLAAPFRLADDGVVDLGEAWALVSENAAAAAALPDRGQLNPGMRADCILVERLAGRPPQVVATISAGRIVHCSDPTRLRL